MEISKFSGIALRYLLLLFSPVVSYTQVITVSPAFPTQNDEVTITFDATQGNGALAGFNGTVYAHTGLITDESTAPNDWKYVQGNWGTADPNVRMTALGDDRYSISYNIRDYYGIPSGETVEQLAFVFRNQDGSIVGRATDGSDIYTPVYPEGTGLTVSLVRPETDDFIVEIGDQIVVEGVASAAASLSLTDNGFEVATTTGSTLLHTITAVFSGNHEVVFTATLDGVSVSESFQYTVAEPTIVENPPAGTEPGVTVLDDTNVRLALYAPNKDYVFVLGSFNDFSADPGFQMKRSVDGTLFWLDISGLDANELYSYQYLVDGSIKIADPYTPVVLDPGNDNFIPSVTYPDLPAYPSEATGILSVFQINPEDYDWSNNNFTAPAVEELVIYELLVRDFLDRHDYQTLTDTLDYLNRLGVNAIELMPVNEFEGNISWGYNPSFHFSVDKYYGPVNALKRFIDEAHNRGIAVILDVVFNHAFSQSPLAQLYWDPVAFKPTQENPWLNPDARHPFNVGYDFNHESEATQYYVNRTLTYFLEDFRFDGFRFDLSKGFTQVNSGNNVNQWSQYDASRIAILKDYSDVIWSINPDAYSIMEHFAANDEEQELADYGMLVWNNMNHEYNEATMGYNSNFAGADYQVRGFNNPHLITYMESHDEERLMYKNIQFGNANADGTYDVKDISTGLDRVELASSFFYTIPGPKMLWQFGELGYDFSINYCPNGTINNSCRVDPKPIRWDYFQDTDRRKLYEITRALIYLKTNYPVFNTTDYQLNVNESLKSVHLNDPEMNVVVLGNFGVTGGSMNGNFQHEGIWYEYFSGDSLMVTNTNTSVDLPAGAYRLYTDQPVELLIPTATSEIIGAEIGLEIFPNPGKDRLTVRYELAEPAQVAIEVYDVLGRKKETLFQGHQSVGVQRIEHTHEWTSGLYFLRIEVAGEVFGSRVVVDN